MPEGPEEGPHPGGEKEAGKGFPRLLKLRLQLAPNPLGKRPPQGHLQVPHPPRLAHQEAEVVL